MIGVALFEEPLAVLRARGRRLARVFDSRARRERIVLVVALCAVTLMLADRLWLTPAFERARLAGQRVQLGQAALDALRAETARVQDQAAEQQRQLGGELTQWRQRVADNSEALRAHEATLVGPQRMVELLDTMLPRHGRLRVRELRSLGRTDLLAGEAAKTGVLAAEPPPAAGPALYRHGVELTIEGGWSDVLQYLQALETMPRRVLWGGLALKVEQHPKVLLTLRLYTLSLDRGWLEI